MVNRDRRNCLITLAGLTSGSIAGCTSVNTGAPSNETATDEPETDNGETTRRDQQRSGTVGESIEGPGGDSVTISNTVVRRTFVYLDGTHPDVAGKEDRQYLFVRGEGTIERKSLRLHLDNQSFRAQSSLDGAPVSNVLFEGEQTPNPGLYGFELPTNVDTSNAEIRLEAAQTTLSWALDDETIAVLSNSPTFDLEAFTVPESVERGEDATVTLRIANRGHTGTFVAELGLTTRSDQSEIYLEVPANQTKSYSTTIDTSVVTGDRSTVVLDRGFAELTKDIAIE